MRVPFADVGPTIIPDWMHEEDAVLLTDACPTGYFGAQLGEINEGDVVVVFGAGPVGLFAAKSSWLMGAGRVIVVDHLDYRLEMARRRSSAAARTTRSPRPGSGARRRATACAPARGSTGPTWCTSRSTWCSRPCPMYCWGRWR